MNAKESDKDGCESFCGRDFESLIEHFGKCIATCPSNSDFYFNRCLCFMRLSRFQEALEDIKKCIELCPSYIKYYEAEVDCHIALGNLNEAEESMATLPMNAEFVLSRMKLIRRQNTLIGVYISSTHCGDHQNALEAINCLLESSPASFTYKLRKVQSFLLLNLYSEAESLLNQIMETKPDNSSVLLLKSILRDLKDYAAQPIEDSVSVSTISSESSNDAEDLIPNAISKLKEAFNNFCVCLWQMKNIN